jgi:DNA-binding transcriptional MerR regulator
VPLFGISVIARHLNVTPEAIRDWERRGLISPPERLCARRVYSDADLATLREWLALRRAARGPKGEATRTV